MAKSVSSKMDKCMKKLDKKDMYLIKLTSMAFILFVITAWPAAMNLVHSIHWGWFLAATIVFMWRPLRKYMTS